LLVLWSVGFFVPWLAGIYLLVRDRQSVGSVASVLAFVMNTIGIHIGLWQVHPIVEIPETLSILPFDIGLYPVSSAFMIHLVMKVKAISPYIWVFIFAIGTTCAEYIGTLIGLVTYNGAWSVWWTLCSYLIPYTVVLIYDRMNREAMRG
jgi:hypothetical protein